VAGILVRTRFTPVPSGEVRDSGKRWIAWTPQGYYDASSGADDLIGWQVNRGYDSAPDFFPASQFRDTYCRPDVIARVLDTLDTDAAVRAASELVDVRTLIKNKEEWRGRAKMRDDPLHPPLRLFPGAGAGFPLRIRP
jgi:hypothetical protein